MIGVNPRKTLNFDKADGAKTLKKIVEKKKEKKKVIVSTIESVSRSCLSFSVIKKKS